MRSSAPWWSNPRISRSANRPEVALRPIGHYDTARGSLFAVLSEPAGLPLRAPEPGRPARRIRDPRARPRTLARGHPERPLHPQPHDTSAASPPAREPRPRPRARERHDRVRADDDALLKLEAAADAPLAGELDDARTGRNVPRRDPVGLEDDDVLVALASADLAGHDVLELVHLEPVEQPLRDGVDQVARLEPRLLARVAADEGRPLEDRVVQLACVRVVRADRADEGARLQPLTPQHRVLRRRDRHDDVLLARVSMRLARLSADARAELLQPVLRAAVGNDAVDRGERLADAGDLRLRLPAAADHTERLGIRLREERGRDAACSPGPELAELVRLDHGRERRLRKVEEDDDEGRATRKPCVGLDPREPELAIGRGHEGEDAVPQVDPRPRPVLDHAAGEPDEARLDRVERVTRRQELRDLVLGHVERHVSPS